jgi:hypothetical protein
MRELINFNELRSMFVGKMTDKYISREIVETWHKDRTEENYRYLDFCYEDPEHIIKAVKCGIHAEIVCYPTGSSFFICPDDYICLCSPFFSKDAEILVKPQESFEKNYVKFN